MRKVANLSMQDELAAKEEELGSAAQKVSMVSERLEMELAAKQALQAKYNCVKADHQKFLLRQKVEELEDLALIRALCRELKDKQDAMETLQAKYDRVKADQQRTRGRFKLLLRNNSLQERFQYLTVMMDETENELMSLMEQNEDLRQKNDYLEADKKKLRQDVEILEGSHQLLADIVNNAFIDSSEPFRKDEPVEKKEMSDANVQTEDFGHLEDGWTLCTTIELIGALCRQLKDKQAAMEALQADYDRVKADQQKSLLRELRDQQEFEELVDLYRKAAEQNEKLRGRMENQGLFAFWSNGVLDQTFRSLEDSFEEAIAKQSEIGALGSNGVLDQTFRSLEDSLQEATAKQNEVDQMIVDVRKKQKPRICGCYRPLLSNTSKICFRCNEAMSGAIGSRIEVGPCGCEESMQLRHRNNSLQEQLQYLTDVVGKDETEGDHVSLMEQNEDLRQKNYHLDADNKKLRQDVEILEGSHQLLADIVNNAFIDSSEPFRKDEPVEKKELSDAQTEVFGRLEDGFPVCTTIKMIEALYQELKDKQAAMEKELGSATQKMARVFERLEMELKAKQALQADYDRVKADQQKLLLREERYKQEFEELEDLYRKTAEQNEKLRDEMENQRLDAFGSNGVLDQTFRSLEDSLQEATAKQNEVDQMIVDVREKQRAKQMQSRILRTSSGNEAMSEAIESRIAVGPCGCMQWHKNNSQQEQLQWLADVVGDDNKKLRLADEILKGSHQLLADIMNNVFILSSKPFRKDEPTEKKVGAFSLEEAIAKQNEFDQRIVNVLKKQEPGCFKSLLVGFLVIVIVFFASLASVPVDSTDPNALYDRHHYI
ncbi:unnamed protein product, partial [Mesorhabditis belari]|uniref:Uncharacterized protein n=1 Tax=Mesorhabditis belari TaxID=2138241 RepID=A0AAF3J2G9_9BILA